MTTRTLGWQACNSGAIIWAALPLMILLQICWLGIVQTSTTTTITLLGGPGKINDIQIESCTQNAVIGQEDACDIHVPPEHEAPRGHEAPGQDNEVPREHGAQKQDTHVPP